MRHDGIGVSGSHGPPAGCGKQRRARPATPITWAGQLSELGFGLKTSKPFFHEFLTDCPVNPELLCRKLEAKGILPGLPLESGILWCCTELNRKPQIDGLTAAIEEVLQDEAAV